VVGNWTVRGIWSALTGRSRDAPRCRPAVSQFRGWRRRPANRVRDGNCLRINGPSITGSTRWRSSAAPVTFGNSGRGILEGPEIQRGPGVHRNFPIGEQYKVSFRWEAVSRVQSRQFRRSAVGTGVGQSARSVPPRRIIMRISVPCVERRAMIHLHESSACVSSMQRRIDVRSPAGTRLKIDSGHR